MTILLRNLISEVANTGPEQRVSLSKISSILEKVLPELTKAQSNKLTELFEEFSEMCSHLNSVPYTRTDNDISNWQVMVSAANEVVGKMREEVEKISESKKGIDLNPLMLALDEVLIN